MLWIDERIQLKAFCLHHCTIEKQTTCISIWLEWMPHWQNFGESDLCVSVRKSWWELRFRCNVPMANSVRSLVTFLCYIFITIDNSSEQVKHLTSAQNNRMYTFCPKLQHMSLINEAQIPDTRAKIVRTADQIKIPCGRMLMYHVTGVVYQTRVMPMPNEIKTF